jgi:CyaY protein
MSTQDQTVSFVERAEAFLAGIERSLDRVADDLDIDVLRAGNVLTLTFENDHRIVINSQEAAQEMWVAARSGGFHYRWNDEAGVWRDTRSADELRSSLSRLIGLETGVSPALGS